MATDYHVAGSSCSHGSAACDDANDGLTRATALCTVQAGLSKLSTCQPGATSCDRLFIHTGTYTNTSAEFPNWSDAGGASASLPIEFSGAIKKCSTTTTTACLVDADCPNGQTCVAGDAISGIVIEGVTTAWVNDQLNPLTADVAVIRVAGVSVGAQGHKIENIRLHNFTMHPGLNKGIYALAAKGIEIDNVVVDAYVGSPAAGSCGTASAGSGPCLTVAPFSFAYADNVTLKNSSAKNGGTVRVGQSGIYMARTKNLQVYNTDIEDFEGGCTVGSFATGPQLYYNNTFKNCQGYTDEQAMFQMYNDLGSAFYSNLVVAPDSGCKGSPFRIWSVRTTGGASGDAASAHIVGNTVIRGACSNKMVAAVIWGNASDFTKPPPKALVFRDNIVQGWGAQSTDVIVDVQALAGPSATVPDCSGYSEAYNYIWASVLPTNKLTVSASMSGKCGNIVANSFGVGTVVTTTTANLSAAYVPNTGSPVIDAADPDRAYPNVTSNTAKDAGVFDKGEAGTFPQTWAVLKTVTGIPEFHWDDTTSTSGAIALLHPKVNPNIRHCSVNTAQTCGSASQAGQAYGCPNGETCLPEPYFELQLDTSPSFDSQGIQTPLYTSGYTASNNLRYWIPPFAITNGDYYVRIRYGDASPATFVTPWSDPFYKVTINYSPSDTTPPPAPDAISPAQGAINVTTPTLASSVVSDNGGSGPVQYEFQIFKGTSTVAPDCTSGLYQDSGWINTNSFPVAGVRRDFTSCLYYGWRVRARDSAVPPNTSGWCCCVTFRATGPTCNPLYPQEPSP